MESAAAVGVGDPVKDDGQDEEGEQVEDFVVDQDVDLEACQASIACEEQKQEEYSCRRCTLVWHEYGVPHMQCTLVEPVDVPANGSRILMMNGRMCVGGN